MLSFLLVWLLTIGLSFLPERYLKPQRPTLNLTTFLLQSLLVSMVFLSITLIVQRPVFASLAVLIFLIILIGVSNAKYQALREPMVFSDFAMFAQAFKHPRLYFPFLGLLPVILAPIIIIGLIIAVMWLEPPLPLSWQRIISTLGGILIAYYIARKLALSLTITGNPAADNARFGLQNSLFAYFEQARTAQHKEQVSKALGFSPFAIEKSCFKYTPPPLFTHFSETKPNITVIQSESFFDARRLHPAIKQDVLHHFDQISKDAIQSGKLQVPAWGANTMRSEFSFLTGLDFKAMGLYRYYPYQFLHKLPISSIASALKSLGYYCVCIHPHHASFFGRDHVFPQMGFDEFIAIDAFDPDDKCGPYISDQAVTQKILDVTQQKTDQPLFIFAITMENHGPLYLEKIREDEFKQFFHATSPAPAYPQHNDLAIYLRHLKNADNMLATLTTAYAKASQETRLCFYGDHVPSMPVIFEQFDYQDNHSDYLIWHSHRTATTQQQDIRIEELAVQLISDFN